VTLNLTIEKLNLAECAFCTGTATLRIFTKAETHPSKTHLVICTSCALILRKIISEQVDAK
jgi:hypothetical protein